MSRVLPASRFAPGDVRRVPGKRCIHSWAQFDRHVRAGGGKLLARLDNYADAVLVAGCQRSGTTALARLITASSGMSAHQFGHDDELDAALILAGWVEHAPRGRYCFQTTYLNDSVGEYTEHTGYRLVWVLRKPESVIASMLHNWKRGALHRLFRHCGQALLEPPQQRRYQRFGRFAVSPLRMACCSYAAKVSQVMSLHQWLPAERLLIVDYDELVLDKHLALQRLYEFISEPWQPGYADALHAGSLHKAERIRPAQHALIEELCLPVYRQARRLLSP
jgi:hypothetical protein